MSHKRIQRSSFGFLPKDRANSFGTWLKPYLISRDQFSGERPGVIWVHVDYISPQTFMSMAYADKGCSLFDLMALAVFDSPKRNHITQLIFSGGAYLVEKGDHLRSSFRHVVYNSPNSKFGKVVLFPDGRQSIKREQPLRGSVAKAFLNDAILNVAVAPGQSKGPIAVYDDILARFGSSPELSQRELVATALIDKGLTLRLLGCSEESIVVYDEVLGRFGSCTEPALPESLGRALFNKGHTLCARSPRRGARGLRRRGGTFRRCHRIVTT